MSTPVREVQTTLVRLELETDGKVSFVRNVADGIISNLTLSNDNFEALKGSAQLSAMIKNTDLITAKFTLSVACSDALTVEPASQVVSLMADEQSKPMRYNLQSSIKEAANHSCIVNLTDADGSLLQSKLVNVSSSGLQQENAFDK